MKGRRMEEEIPASSFYYRIGKALVDVIEPDVVKEKKLETIFDVMRYLRTLPRLSQATQYQREAIFDGKIGHRVKIRISTYLKFFRCSQK